MMKDSPSKKPAWDFHPTVFLTSAIIIILAVVISLIYIGQNSAEQAEQLFSSLKTTMSNATGRVAARTAADRRSVADSQLKCSSSDKTNALDGDSLNSRYVLLSG